MFLCSWKTMFVFRVSKRWKISSKFRDNSRKCPPLCNPICFMFAFFDYDELNVQNNSIYLKIFFFINIFTVIFGQFNISLLNKSINYLKKSLTNPKCFLRKNTDMSCAGISQAAVSRGKSLVERVVKEQVSQSLSCLVCLWMNSVQLSWLVYQYSGFLLCFRNVFRWMGSWQTLWNGGQSPTC